MPFKIDFAYDNMMSTFILDTRLHHTLLSQLVDFFLSFLHFIFYFYFLVFYFLNLMGLSVYQHQQDVVSNDAATTFLESFFFFCFSLNRRFKIVFKTKKLM